MKMGLRVGPPPPKKKGFYKKSGQMVFNNNMTAAQTYQELNLWGFIDNAPALVFLEVISHNGGCYSAKPKGYGTNVWANHTHSTGRQFGGCNFHSEGDPEYAYMCLPTDETGKIEHAAENNTTNWEIRLIGFVD